MDPRYLLGIIVGVVLGWFAIGVIFNLRRGEALLRWMQGGLPKIGERTTLRWLGSSVAELVIAKAKSPFRQLETLLVLTPRDIPWMWVWAQLRGRRDTFILRGHLSNPPRIDLEMAYPSFWTGRQSLDEAAARGWEAAPYLDRQLMAPPGTLDQAAAEAARLEPLLAPLGTTCWRLSLRRDLSQVIVHLPFPSTRSDPSEFFAAVRALARAVAE